MSQREQILEHMKRGHCVTPLDALRRFGCMRLAARIAELRDDGHGIHARLVEEGGRRFARYTLIRGER